MSADLPGDPDDPDGEDDDVCEPDVSDIEADGDDPAAPALPARVVTRFLSSQRALDIAADAVRSVVPPQQVDDLAADTVVAALRARPPRLEGALVSWLRTIASRVAIAWLERRKRRRKYEGRMPAEPPEQDPGAGDAGDAGAVEPTRSFFDQDPEEDPGEMLDAFLERTVAPRDRPILEIMRERAAKKKPYYVLAGERDMTVDQLDGKLRRFKAKYAPAVRRRRDLMLILKLGGLALAVAVGVVIWLLWPRAEKDTPHTDPTGLPSPNTARHAVEDPFVSAPAPTRDARLESASRWRDAALAACKDGKWQECLDGLDVARTLDPEGDTTTAVANARSEATRALGQGP